MKYFTSSVECGFSMGIFKGESDIFVSKKKKKVSGKISNLLSIKYQIKIFSLYLPSISAHLITIIVNKIDYIMYQILSIYYIFVSVLQDAFLRHARKRARERENELINQQNWLAFELIQLNHQKLINFHLSRRRKRKKISFEIELKSFKKKDLAYTDRM